MAAIWEAPADIANLVRRVKEKHHHPRLALASIWVLVSDSKAIRDNRFVPTQSRKCTRTEKLSSAHDFKIVVMAEAWEMLTNEQRFTAIDEALCRCGVRYIPQMLEINGKKEPVKDDLGRTIYTDEISYDKEGVPKWKINAPDAGLYFGLLGRHGEYCEEARNVVRALAGKPLIEAVAAPRADDIVDPDA